MHHKIRYLIELLRDHHKFEKRSINTDESSNYRYTINFYNYSVHDTHIFNYRINSDI